MATAQDDVLCDKRNPELECELRITSVGRSDEAGMGSPRNDPES